MKQQVIITTDLGYGDAGKGTMVDALVHQYDVDLVVRYSGGAQAAHNVVTPEGRHHTFAQFSSGTFRTGTKTYLGPKMLVQPNFLISEAKALTELGIQNPLSLLSVHHQAPVITSYHMLANRLKELVRGANRHGSCGIGIGETRSDSENSEIEHLIIGDLLDQTRTEKKLRVICEQKKTQMLQLLQEHATDIEIVEMWHQFNNESMFEDTLRAYQVIAEKVQITDDSVLSEHLSAGRRVVMEASQGTLLDEDYGFFPYVTRGKVRTVHAHELLEAVGYKERPYVLGITRAYAARHGPGPFPTESVELGSKIQELHNGNGKWQGAFRMGHFDAVATRYAIAINSDVDGLAVTCLDQLPRGPESLCIANEYRNSASGNEVMRDLPLLEPGNLEALADRSEFIMNEITPIYTQVHQGTESMADAISSACNIELAATSSGVTRDEKVFFQDTSSCLAA